MTNATKYQRNHLLNFYAIYEALNADNSTTFWIWFDDKHCEAHATNSFFITNRWQ